MAGHIGKHGGHILRGHKIPPRQICCRPCHAGQRQRRTGAEPQRQARFLTAGLGKIDDIAIHQFMDKHPGYLFLHSQQVGLVGHGVHLFQQGALAAARQHLHLGLGVRVAHDNAHGKTVQLGLRQHLGTGGTHGVFGGDNGKGRGHGVGHAVHRHVSLLHDLQQRRLGTARGTVDLITQKQVAHYAAGVVYQPPGLLLEHGKAHNVRGQHVRGKLHAALVQLQRAGKGQRQRRFAHTGDVLDQHMAARQHGHPDGVYRLLFALHGLVYFGRNGGGLLCVLHD